MPDKDEWAEADMLADDSAGKPLKRTAQEGITAMEQRIASLSQRLQELNDRVRRQEISDSTAAATMAALNAQLHDARSRRAEYQTQLDGSN